MATLDDVNFGPLKSLVGTWKGDKGMDIAPEPDGTEENPYYETISIIAVGDVKNAESQHISMLRYHQEVKRKSNDEVFHDETGYWMWDQNENIIMNSLLIPRAVAVLAKGPAPQTDQSGQTVFQVDAKIDDPAWGILQSPFMHKNAKSTAFSRTFIVNGNKLSYKQETVVDIYGKTFSHTDENELIKQG